jgi:hypothetical protein
MDLTELRRAVPYQHFCAYIIPSQMKCRHNSMSHFVLIAHSVSGTKKIVSVTCWVVSIGCCLMIYARLIINIHIHKVFCKLRNLSSNLSTKILCSMWIANLKFDGISVVEAGQGLATWARRLSKPSTVVPYAATLRLLHLASGKVYLHTIHRTGGCKILSWNSNQNVMVY